MKQPLASSDLLLPRNVDFALKAAQPPGIGVDLHHAGEAGEMIHGSLPLAVPRVDISDGAEPSRADPLPRTRISYLSTSLARLARGAIGLARP
jgi:hypothetical protein